MTTWSVVSGFILGTVLGSLVKALADRSLGNRTFWGRSYCPNCKKSLQWYDLIPIFSFIFLRGRCRYCHKKIGIEYLVVEVVMGILVGFLFWQSFNGFSTRGGPVFGWQFSILLIDVLFKTFFITILAILFITDIKKMFIPDRITFPAIKIALVYLVSATFYKIGYLYYYLSLSPIGQKLLPPYSTYFQRHALYVSEPFFYSLVSGLALAGFFLALIIITKGKGMGGGDVKLAGFIGLGLGFPISFLAIMLSFLTGAIFSVVLIIRGKKHFGESIPFGPFLVLGSLIALFWGNQILDWYLHLSM